MIPVLKVKSICAVCCVRIYIRHCVCMRVRELAHPCSKCAANPFPFSESPANHCCCRAGPCPCADPARERERERFWAFFRGLSCPRLHTNFPLAPSPRAFCLHVWCAKVEVSRHGPPTSLPAGMSISHAVAKLFQAANSGVCKSSKRTLHAPRPYGNADIFSSTAPVKLPASSSRGTFSWILEFCCLQQ